MSEDYYSHAGQQLRPQWERDLPPEAREALDWQRMQPPTLRDIMVALARLEHKIDVLTKATGEPS